MKMQRRWRFSWESFLLLLLPLAAELQTMSNFLDESSLGDPNTLRHELPSVALSRKKRSSSAQGVNVTNLEEEELSGVRESKSFSGPTALQIAQARKLILKEGKEGDSTPFHLQKMDLDTAPTSSSPSFAFRLTNSSFLDAFHNGDLFSSFSNLRKVIDDEQKEENGDELHADVDDSKNTVTNETKSQSSVNELIEKDKRLLAEMISKKIGFAFRTAEKVSLAKQDERSNNSESQYPEAHIPAHPPLCPLGSGHCRSLRERLLEDLVSSYSDPFTARIRYRLKRKPSVYTTRIPKIRNDIGIPDIYETEVTVMPQEAQNLSEISDSSHDQSVTEPAPGHLQLLSPRRPAMSLSAIRQRTREQSEVSESLKTRAKGTNETREKNRGRKSQAAMRRYLARRRYRHPSRMRTRTHLDYRRPVTFKFRRAEDPTTQAKHEAHYEDVPAIKLPIHPLQEKRQGVETLPSSSLPRRASPSKTIQKHKQRQPIPKPDIFKQESDEANSKVSAESKNFKTLLEYQNVDDPHTSQATTEASVFYKNEAPDHGSDEYPGIKDKYKGPDPPQDYEVSSSPHQLNSKSATVPGWLMNLKDVSLTLTPPPHYHPQRSKPKQTAITSSPMPANYALKASNPSALPPTYTTASPQRDPTREPHFKSHNSEKNHQKSKASYNHGSTPHHFHIIHPGQKSTHSRQNPPPPNIRIPLETDLLPSVNTAIRDGQTSIFPYYPVIPSSNQTSGSKYSVKATTPSAIYVTPGDISSSPLRYGKESETVYAPPTSPKPTYAPPDPVISVKPHLDVNSQPYKAHISAVDLRDHYKNISSHPIVTHLTPINYEYIEHKASTNNSTSHRVIVSPKTHRVTVTPKFPLTSVESHAPIHFPKSYTSPVVPTTFKPSLPRDNLAQLQKARNPLNENIVKLPISTSKSPLPVHTPATQLIARLEPSDKITLPEISLVPYILEDYVTGHNYYDDYYDYYDYHDDGFFNYFDDLYNYDYLYDVLGVAESRLLLPLHVLPETFPKGQMQNFGYIAGIPGRAGKDYPVLGYIPDTSFGCGLVAEYPGYYADMDAGCQVFHVCHHDGTQDSYLCPNGTIFNQKYFVCDWWYNFNCEDAPFFYPVNAALSYAGLTVHDSRPYYDLTSSSLTDTRGNNRPRRGQNRRPTKRRVPPRKAYVQGARYATRRRQALASKLHRIAVAPMRQLGVSGYRAPRSGTSVHALHLTASEFPYLTRVPNVTLPLSDNARSVPASSPEEFWIPATYNATEIQD